MRYFRCFLPIAALGLFCLTAGCHSEDTGQTDVKFDPAKTAADNQKEIERVKNDPKIPEQQKQAILGRLQSQGKPTGEAAAKSGAGK